MKKRHINIQETCLIGIITAIICIMAQISIPMPFGVPMTMQTFAVALAGIILGAKKGCLCTLIYVILGGIGLPVFSNFTGGFQCLIGPTGGFILSFPIMAYCIGLGLKYKPGTKATVSLGLIAGNTINLLAGTVVFCWFSQTDFLTGLATCVLPLLPITILKAWLACSIGLRIRKHLNR